MGLNLSAMLIDTQKEVDGVRFDFPDGAYIIAARPGNPKTVAENARLRKQYEQQLKYSGDKEKDLLNKEILAKVLFRSVFLEWSGFEIDGKEFEYTEENCIKLYTDSKYSRIGETFLAAVQQGEENGEYRFVPNDQESEEIAKN